MKILSKKLIKLLVYVDKWKFTETWTNFEIYDLQIFFNGPRDLHFIADPPDSLKHDAVNQFYNDIVNATTSDLGKLLV